MHKDEVLDRLARTANVAQFVSFRPDADRPMQTFSRIAGQPPNQRFDTVEGALAALLQASAEASINIRSYEPEGPRSREFLYGLTDVEAAREALNRLTAAGLHTIVNETVDVGDGGVSGVAHGGTVEFAPDDTPRCVEKPGVVSMPHPLAARLIEIVYGFEFGIAPSEARVEFSVHPSKRGTRHEHVLVWEWEEGVPTPSVPVLTWPNRFSRHIGDKAFGLLAAHLYGFPVPQTLVISRRIAPFSFGRSTGSAEKWIRTCPVEQKPGQFTTARGWLDPFELMRREDPGGDQIASVLSQAAVPAVFSGATVEGPDGLIIEGLPGAGDSYMLGIRRPEVLPNAIHRHVSDQARALAEKFGPVRFEWVHDGERLWIVQLHVGATKTTRDVLYPGEAQHWRDFDVELGLEALRDMIDTLPSGSGIRLIGEVGLTSHFADLIRRASIPARIRRQPAL